MTIVKLLRRQFLHLAASAAVLAAMTAPVAAQSPSLAGKNVQMIIGFGTGGGFDLWGRVVARHIGKHLPGKPTVVPQNMPGAGSFNAANYIYDAAPKDGSAIALISGDAVLGPIMGRTGARFDPLKFSWVGTVTADTSICAAFNRPQMKVKTLKDLYERELVVGSGGVGNGAYTYPKALNALLGMKFKIIVGFPASSDIYLAIERGELDGSCPTLDGISSVRPDWIPDKKVVVLFQGPVPHAALKDVPSIIDQARTSDEKAAIEFLYAGNDLGKPLIAPPGMPIERTKMLQNAFMATMKDPDFLADAKRQKFDVVPGDGEHVAALIKKIYATPKPIVDKVSELIK